MTSARDPFEQLERCHRRLEEHLAELSGIAREARSAAADVDAIRDVAGFFARAIRRHEADEETSFFPRLRAHAALSALLDQLAAEHQEHVALHARLDAVIEVLDRAPDDAAGIAELGALTEAQRLGLSVPHDVAIVGFDDSRAATLVWPELTTVRQPLAEMAMAAVGMLLSGEAQADEHHAAPVRVLPHEVVVRGSSSAPPRGRA